MHGVVVEVSSQRFGIPFECPCCGATPPNAELTVRAQGTGQGLLFPYCKRCIEHVRTYEASGVASAGVMVLGILLAVFIGFAASVLVAVGVFVVSASLAWWLRVSRRNRAASQRGASCAASGIAVDYQGWANGTSAFSFESPTFAARFAEQNSALLANETPQLRKLIDGYRRARLAVPTPAVAAGIAPPPLTPRDWLARVEATEGIVARRVQLGRALEMVEDAHLRRELIQTVARLELAPLVAKLTAMTSPAAKRSQLERSLDEIRQDNIPDELREAELQQLQARLAELA